MSSVTNSLYDRIHEQSQGGGLQRSREPSTNTAKPLNFHKAMDDFTTMFPHIDPDVIETVLRANDGIVQVTIDQLLVISEGITDSETVSKTSSQPRLPDYAESVSNALAEEPPPAYSEIDNGGPFIASGSANGNSRNGQQRLLPSNIFSPRISTSSNWNPPMLGDLPDDFLRLTVDSADSVSSNESHQSNSSRIATLTTSGAEGGFYSDNQVEQFLEDEKLAMFLQNEEFIRELRHNSDFVMSLEEDHRSFMLAQGARNSAETTPSNGVISSPPMGGARPKISPPQDDVVFRHKLKHMGKTTRKKFGKLAKRFSRKKGGRVPLQAESTANLLEDDLANEQEFTNVTNVNEVIEESGTISPALDSRSPREEQLESRMTGRKLPPTPSARSPSHDEPIVFYSEDNEFTYKTEH